ncbi:hypothetical protein [Amycolatopsis sp. NPDC049868]|uniref:hypothetical protein n=1 Tax=Amycolatopsis sp. NPDC049868 TaxID=3363934 RepID=UPI00379D9FC1
MASIPPELSARAPVEIMWHGGELLEVGLTRLTRLPAASEVDGRAAGGMHGFQFLRRCGQGGLDRGNLAQPAHAGDDEATFADDEKLINAPRAAWHWSQAVELEEQLDRKLDAPFLRPRARPDRSTAECMIWSKRFGSSDFVPARHTGQATGVEHVLGRRLLAIPLHGEQDLPFRAGVSCRRR